MTMNEAVKKARMIWAFFIISVVVYATLAFLLIKPIETALNHNLRYIFYLAAFICLVLSRKFKRASLDALTDTSGNASRQYLSTSVISFAYSDAIAVIGLVCFILFGEAVDIVLLAGLSLVSLIRHFPKVQRGVMTP